LVEAAKLQVASKGEVIDAGKVVTMLEEVSSTTQSVPVQRLPPVTVKVAAVVPTVEGNVTEEGPVIFVTSGCGEITSVGKLVVGELGETTVGCDQPVPRVAVASPVNSSVVKFGFPPQSGTLH